MHSPSSPQHLQILRERTRQCQEEVRRRMAWTEERRRELWARTSPAPPAGEPAPSPREPAPGAPPERSAAAPARGHEQARVEREVRFTEIRSGRTRWDVDDEREAERRWLRDEVRAMRRDGWSWEEMADVGFTPELLAGLGIELVDASPSAKRGDPIG